MSRPQADPGVLILPAYMTDYARSIASELQLELGDKAPAVEVREQAPCDCQPYAENGRCPHSGGIEWRKPPR